MTLTFLFAWLLFGGLVAWLSGRWSKNAPRWISLIVMIVHLIVTVKLWIAYLAQNGLGLNTGQWFMSEKAAWIPQWGISYFLAIDGLSILLLVLTSFLGLLAVACSWKGIQEKVGFKIREAEIQKIPYMIIVGEKEVNNKKISIRKRKEGDIGQSTIEDFVKKIEKEITEKIIN